MPKKLLMGNEAIAFGAIKAGVNVVVGYPGTPSTEVLETIAEHNPGDIYVEWSVNEKVAMEVGAGACYTGARVMVTMKQVGLNVASDPLMSLAYIGVKGGLVILVADDPGPISSQTEQDTRHFAKFSNLPVFDPSSPEEAYNMVQEAFELSEKVGLPVFLRPTTRVCHSCSTLDVPDVAETQRHAVEGFKKDPRWVIFPSLSYRRHIEIEDLQEKISGLFSDIPFNTVSGKGRKGIAASGMAYACAIEALDDLQAESGNRTAADVKVFKVGTPYPFPAGIAREFLEGVEEVLVLEELDPVVEEGLLELVARNNGKPEILGKKTKHLPAAGEYTYELVRKAIAAFLGMAEEAGKPLLQPPQLPARPPVLCAGCPHRAAFYAVKQAMKGKKAIFTGDIGCYTLGNAKPLEMVDTCLCMGAGITIAQGLKRAEPDGKHIAFIGDSTFFHTGISGIVNAVYNQTDVTIAILDNSTTAMTGHQPHPGTGKTMMGSISEKIDIYGVVAACGVKHIVVVNPLDQKAAIEAVRQATAFEGPAVVIFKAPCIALFKPTNVQAVLGKCISCKKCIREIGCPAISADGDIISIEPSLCYGCKLCSSVCPVNAIGGAD